MPLQWFRRMGDIPGLQYEPPVPVDRSQLPHLDATATLRRSEFDGRLHEFTEWHSADEPGGYATSQSPAHRRVFDAMETSESSSEELLDNLWKTLETPGEAADYHFAIQTTAGYLYGRRLDEPEILSWSEWLSWLDVRLIQAVPSAVWTEDADGSGSYYQVAAFHTLLDLYQREGFLGEALEVAEIARSFGQNADLRPQIEERIELLRAEDAG